MLQNSQISSMAVFPAETPVSAEVKKAYLSLVETNGLRPARLI